MFSDKYGLTDAVLKGRKTMKRRLVGNRMTDDDIKAYLKGYTELVSQASYFKIGEVVAVAQRYRDLAGDCRLYKKIKSLCPGEMPWNVLKGWNNKIFVKSDLMPHRIRITDIKAEKLQDISDEDCIEEGITTMTEGKFEVGNAFGWDTKIDALKRESFFTPRAAFAALIDKVSGKGTWALNPWVFAYTFVLVD